MWPSHQIVLTNMEGSHTCHIMEWWSYWKRDTFPVWTTLTSTFVNIVNTSRNYEIIYLALRKIKEAARAGLAWYLWTNGTLVSRRNHYNSFHSSMKWQKKSQCFCSRWRTKKPPCRHHIDDTLCWSIQISTKYPMHRKRGRIAFSELLEQIGMQL